jgi:hypothetical protein
VFFSGPTAGALDQALAGAVPLRTALLSSVRGMQIERRAVPRRALDADEPAHLLPA